MCDFTCSSDTDCLRTILCVLNQGHLEQSSYPVYIILLSLILFILTIQLLVFLIWLLNVKRQRPSSAVLQLEDLLSDDPNEDRETRHSRRLLLRE